MSTSESKSSSSTQTTNEDNRVLAEGGGIAQAKGATFNYENEFSDNVAAAFNELVDLSRSAGQVAVDMSGKAVSTTLSVFDKLIDLVRDAGQAALASSERSLAAVSKNTEILQKQDVQGGKSIITDIFPMVAVVIVGVGVVYFFKK